VRLQFNGSGKANKVAKTVKVEEFAVGAEETVAKESYGKLMAIVVKTAENNAAAMKVHKPGDLVTDTDTYSPFVFCFTAGLVNYAQRRNGKLCANLVVDGSHPVITVP
jgi:hypothetical protein